MLTLRGDLGDLARPLTHRARSRMHLPRSAAIAPHDALFAHGDLEELPAEFFVGHVVIGVHGGLTVSRPSIPLVLRDRIETQPASLNTRILVMRYRVQYADLGEDHTALPGTLGGRDDRMPGPDELAPSRPGEVSEQVRGAQLKVVAAGDARLGCESSPHADLVPGACRIEEPREELLAAAAHPVEAAEESEGARKALVANQQLRQLRSRQARRRYRRAETGPPSPVAPKKLTAQRFSARHRSSSDVVADANGHLAGCRRGRHRHLEFPVPDDGRAHHDVDVAGGIVMLRGPMKVS